MRKAVAVPYVIALILGVAVIALIGIWFVMSGGKFSKQSLETKCLNKLLLYCTTLRENKPRTELWDSKCNTILGITTTFPPIEKCP